MEPTLQKLIWSIAHTFLRFIANQTGNNMSYIDHNYDNIHIKPKIYTLKSVRTRSDLIQLFKLYSENKISLT